MLFTSPEFAWFFLAVLLAHLVVPRPAHRGLWLAASLAFYASWAFPQGLKFLPLLIGTAALDYTLAKHLFLGGSRRLVALSVVSNLGVLGLFKYLGFFGALAGLDVPKLALPLGISFFTFQSMSYVIDASRNVGRPYPTFRDFLVYVTFFPQLIAGPITRAEFFRTQVGGISLENVERGLRICVAGALLKVGLADGLAPWVDAAWRHPETLSAGDAWLTTLGFAVQIWSDFAGYSLLAVGLARCLGIALPMNFRQPYLAAGPREFWRRWHITLSEWLRDYVYVPLGGNRYGPSREAMAVLITMVLGGFWHGAGWGFVIWGLGHGLWRVAAVGLDVERVPKILRQLGTFALVALLWIPFRAPTFAAGWAMVAALGRGGDVTLALGLLPALIAAVVWHVIFGHQPVEGMVDKLEPRWAGLWHGIGWSLVVLLYSRPAEFIYFAF